MQNVKSSLFFDFYNIFLNFLCIYSNISQLSVHNYVNLPSFILDFSKNAVNFVN